MSKAYMRGVDRFRHEGRVISDFCRSTHKTLGNVAEMKAGLNAESLLRHQGLADWWVAFWWTVLQFAVVSTEHKPHATSIYSTWKDHNYNKTCNKTYNKTFKKSRSCKLAQLLQPGTPSLAATYNEMLVMRAATVVQVLRICFKFYCSCLL